MSFYDALIADETAKGADALITKLRSSDLPSDVRDRAQTIATEMEGIDASFDEFRSDLASHPNYFQDNRYSFEGARDLQTAANQKLIADNDPSGLINRLEWHCKELLSLLKERARPLPPVEDPILLETLLMGARQDARDALAKVTGNLPEAILRLQEEAMENGSEDALAFLLGATPWAERYIKASGTDVDVIDFDKIKGTLRDNVSDANSTPYRQAHERLLELEDLGENYRASWRAELEVSGILEPVAELTTTPQPSPSY